MADNVFSSWANSHLLKGRITNPNIEVGDYTYYSGYYHKEEFEDICVRYLVGDKTTRNYKEIFGKNYEFDKLVIGKFCSIASGVVFLMGGNQGHNIHWMTTYPFSYLTEDAPDGFQPLGDTIVGNDVWIGTEALILPGVKIGDGAIIGSRAVVTKNVEPYTIVAGNPAKVIRRRFKEDEIEMLKELKWWEWDIEKIKKNSKLLSSNKISTLYELNKPK